MRDLLTDAYLARIEFHLEFAERFQLEQQMLLHLRRELAGAARFSGDDRLVNYIDPALPDDPYARRVFQKPSPPFVIQASEVQDTLLDAGDSFVLKVLFFGNLTDNIIKFARLLEILGDIGIFKGEGRYDLEMVVGRDQAGNQQLLWRGHDLPDTLAVPQLSLLWHIEGRSIIPGRLDLVITTPARLLADGRPLFNPTFGAIFPFILRRVTSMLYFWSGVEAVGDTHDLLSLAAEVTEEGNELAWHDWRQIEQRDSRQELGGLLGAMHLGPVHSETLLTILLLGELFNIGRGAAYGAGHYCLAGK